MMMKMKKTLNRERQRVEEANGWTRRSRDEQREAARQGSNGG